MKVVLSRVGLRILIRDLTLYPILAWLGIGLPAAILPAIDRFHPFLPPNGLGELEYLVGVCGLVAFLFGSCPKVVADYNKLTTLADVAEFMAEGGAAVTDVLEKAVYRSASGFRQFRSTRVDTFSLPSPVPPHFHLESLGADQHTIVESSVVRTRWPMQHGTVRVVGDRRFAVTNGNRHSNGRYFLGTPPEVTGRCGRRKRLPAPSIVIWDPREDGVFLWRFTEMGDYEGDTWHPNPEEAQQQALYEFGEHLGEWQTVSSDPPRIVSRILERI